MLLDPLAIAVVILTAILSGIDAFAPEDSKRRWSEMLALEVAKLSDSEPLVILRKPLALCDWCVNKICGSVIWSRRSLFRLFAASLVVVVASLAAISWKTGLPFGSGVTPWSDFARPDGKRAFDDIPKKPTDLNMSDEEYRETMKAYLNTWPIVLDDFLCDPGNIWIHATVIVLIGLAIVGATSAVCWSISRKMIRKLVAATEAWDIWSNMCLNLCLILVVSVGSATALGVVVFPEMRVIAIVAPKLVAVGGLWGALGVVGAASAFGVVALFLAKIWFQTVVAVCLLPSLCAATLYPLLLLSYWWREQMHRGMNWALGRMISFKSGPISWSIRVVGFSGAILWLLKRSV